VRELGWLIMRTKSFCVWCNFMRVFGTVCGCVWSNPLGLVNQMGDIPCSQ